MSKRDDSVSLGDMLSHAKEAIEMLGGVSKDDFMGDRLKQLAVTRLVEIVGESANRVTDGTQKPTSGDSVETNYQYEKPTHTRL